MDNFDEKSVLDTQETPDEPSIFGRSKSREEIKAEEKAKRAKELAALREARQQAKIARKAAGGSSKRELVIVAAVLFLVLAIGGVAIGRSIAADKEEASYQMSETNTGYFADDEAKPSLEKDGISAAINEMYYTAGGHLCVHMTLGNGTDKDMTLDSLDVSISNEKEALIAGGATNAIDKSYRIKAGGYNTYTLYIKPEHVKIANDSLETITYKITAVGTKVEE